MSARPSLPTAEEIGTLVPIGRVAKNTPYSADFLRQLARSGKIRVYKLHRDWLTTPAAVRDYLKSQTKRHEKALGLLHAAEKAFLAVALLIVVLSATPQARAQGISNPPSAPSAISAAVHNLTSSWQQFSAFYGQEFSAIGAKANQALLSFGQALLGKTPEEYLADAPVRIFALAKHPIQPRSPETPITATSAAAAAPKVLGLSTGQPALTENPVMSATQMTALVNQTLQRYLNDGKFTGPQGPPGPSGEAPGFTGPNGIVQNDSGKTTSVIGGMPIVTYIPSAPQNGFGGTSLAGFGQLSSAGFTTQTLTATGLTTLAAVNSGDLAVLGNASVSGTFSAATSTLSALTVSGSVTLSGSTTIANLTVTGLNPGLTQGSVIFQGASGLTQDNSDFFYDATNHRLGVGTSAPTSTLFVQGTGAVNSFVVASSSGMQLLTVTSSGNVGIGNTAPLAILDVGSNHDFQFLPSNTYGTSTMAGTGPAISTKYGGLYLGLAAGDPSYGIDVNPISNSPNGTRVLSYSMASFCFTSSYPEVDCPIQASNNGNLTIGRAFEGQQVAQNNGLLVQNRVGIGTITPMSTLFVQGTTSYPTLNLFTLASTTGTQLFTVTPAGNVGIGTSTPTLGPLTMASGAYVTTGGVWTNASDRNLKENFATVSLADILQKIDQLPVIEWNYQNEDPSIKHVGPVAQDFYAIFQVGNSSTSISTIDPAGIALLGIQALNQKFTVLQGGLTGNATVTNLSMISPANFSGDSVGEAKILAGKTSVRVTFSQPYVYQPIVTVTAVDFPTYGYVSGVDATGFTVNLPTSAPSDVTFDWHSFASPGAQLTVSDGRTQPIALVVATSSEGSASSIMQSLAKTTESTGTPEVFGTATFTSDSVSTDSRPSTPTRAPVASSTATADLDTMQFSEQASSGQESTATATITSPDPSVLPIATTTP